jgi:hypothetical protein
VTPTEIAKTTERLLWHLVQGDLPEVPYVTHADESPDVPKDRVRGWTAQSCDLTTRPVLSERWRGRGPAVVTSGELPVALATGIHECSHVLQFAYVWRFDDSDTSPTNESVRAGLVTDVSDINWSNRTHDLRFHRALAHLMARLPEKDNGWAWRQIGLTDPEWHLSFIRAIVPCSAGQAHDLSPWAAYQEVFADECRRRRHEPVTKILETPPPSDAVELYERDCQARAPITK